METSNMFGSRNYVLTFNFTMILKIINKNMIILRMAVLIELDK